MTARENILARLNKHRRMVEGPGVWQSKRDLNDLAVAFTAALRKAKGEVHRAESLEAAMVVLSGILEEIEAKTAVYNNQEPLSDLALPDRWPGITWYKAGEETDSFRTFCATAHVGITGVEAALAETGTAVVGSGPGRSRLTPLLPPVHVALIGTSQITTDIFTWTASRQGKPQAAVTLVSGPSKTADIEQTMAIGVHGPKRFIVILFDD